MKPQILLACAAFATLTGCASVGGPGDRVAQAERQPVSGFTRIAFNPLPSNFCQGVAANDYARLQSTGFDASTVQRLTQSSLQQCQMLWAGNHNTTATFQVAMRTGRA